MQLSHRENITLRSGYPHVIPNRQTWIRESEHNNDMNWHDLVPQFEQEFDIDVLYDNGENLVVGLRAPEDEPILGIVFIVDVSGDDEPENLSTTFVRQVILPSSFLWRLLRHDGAQPLVAPSADLVFTREGKGMKLSLAVGPDESLDVQLDEEQTEELLEAADVFEGDPEKDVVQNIDGTWTVPSVALREGHRLASTNRELMNAVAAEIVAAGYEPEELSLANLVIAEDVFRNGLEDLPQAIADALDEMTEPTDDGHREFQQSLLKLLTEQIPEIAETDDASEAFALAFEALQPSAQTFLTVLHEGFEVPIDMSLAVAIGRVPAHVLIESACAEYEADSDEDFATRHNFSILLDYLALSRIERITSFT